jgi:predicted dehydrogenase
MVKLVTLDPAHFHAALVQKFMHPQISPVVRVYAPDGDELREHLQRIAGFNARAENPTTWEEQVYTGADFLAKMCAERAGNVVIISGNNARKAQYILAAVAAGFNVLADKPMAVVPADFATLQQAFQLAAAQRTLLYDIMTERSEITTVLQQKLARLPAVFGELEQGTPAEPAITKASVHHYFKEVAGRPLKRPAWFFDTVQQGEAIVDVTTHLVDLVQWECFPDQIIDWQKDINVLQARRWTTKITPAEFKRATLLDRYPDYLKKDVGADGNLAPYCNGEFTYTLKGIHAKIAVRWKGQAPEGAKDTYYSTLRGTKANLVIRQGKEQDYKATLYIECQPGADTAAFERALKAGVARLAATYPGLAVQQAAVGTGWQIVIPEQYNVGHEAHFAQVTERYLQYLAAGKLPAWEVPNMLAKYYTTLAAYQQSR